MKQDKHYINYKMGSNKILSSSLRSKSRKIQPTPTATGTGGEEKSKVKQQKEQQKNSSSSNHQKSSSNSKRLSSTLSSSDDDSKLSESNVERREKKKLHRGTISRSRWNRWCSWVEEEPTSDNNDGSLYHILDDSGGHDGTEGDEKCCLDVSDSKWLSLMDVLLKDELSFLGKS
eukprot:964951_1